MTTRLYVALVVLALLCVALIYALATLNDPAVREDCVRFMESRANIFDC